MRPELIEVTKDEDVVSALYEAAKSSMGQNITEADKVPFLHSRPSLGYAQEA